MTPIDPMDDYEFCYRTLRRLGYKGDLMKVKEVGQFLTDYLIEQSYKTRWNEYSKILSLPILSKGVNRHYCRYLAWLLGMIVTANCTVASIPSSVHFPSCEK